MKTALATSPSPVPVIILIGPPGGGKGTQAQKLVKKFNHLHISTGELLRNRREVLDDTERQMLDSGQLLPDTAIMKLVDFELTKRAPEQGIILDGVPRTTAQVKLLDETLEKHGLVVTKAIRINVARNVIIERAVGRRVCSNSKYCTETYHLKSKPPQTPDTCDVCHSPLTTRPDDNEATATRRFDTYWKEVAPIVLDYRNRDSRVFSLVEGDQPPETVFGEICRSLA